MSKNGETTIETANLSYDDKFDILIQAVAELTDKVDGLVTQNEELVEKLNNLTVSGSGFAVDEFDEN